MLDRLSLSISAENLRNDISVVFCFVGAWGIGPHPHPPQGRALPLRYAPNYSYFKDYRVLARVLMHLAQAFTRPRDPKVTH